MTKAIRISHRTYREYVVKRKARVDHICSECGKDILRGEEYYQDNFAPIVRIGGFLVKGHSQQSWTQKKICEECWKGPQLQA